MTHLAVVIPSRRDSANVIRLIGELDHTSLGRSWCSVIVVDNGLNDELGEWTLPPRTELIREAEEGAGYALAAGARHAVARWQSEGVSLADCWVLSLDADVAVDPHFLDAWKRHLDSDAAVVYRGAFRFDLLDHEQYELPEATIAAFDYVLHMQYWYERFTGVVNTSTNHAVRADALSSLGYHLQPVESSGDTTVTVAGADWDLGLRSRLAGHRCARNLDAVCATSARRLAEDPAGFVSGRAYEAAFSITGEPTSHSWPPSEWNWAEIVDFSAARIAAHFLLKPVLAGLTPDPDLALFLGTPLHEELLALSPASPCEHHSDPPAWLAYREQLVAQLFQPDHFELSGRIARKCGFHVT